MTDALKPIDHWAQHAQRLEYPCVNRVVRQGYALW